MPVFLNFLLALVGLGAAASVAGGSSDGESSEPSSPAPGAAGDAPEATVPPPVEEDDEDIITPPAAPASPSDGGAEADAPDLPNSAYALDWAGLTAQEQYMLELVNRARMDPEAEVERTGYANDSGVSSTPKQALAVDPILSAAADNHSADMLARDFFDHRNPDGDGPTDRAVDEGWTGSGVWENIAARWTSASSVSDTQGWIDASHVGLWESDGHQRGMLQDGHTVTGISVDWGSDWDYPDWTASTAMVVTEKFANDGQTYLTGVVYDDGDNDDFYDIGEGQGDVRITVWNEAETYTTSTWDAGGYSIAVDAGTYTVRFEGGDLSGAYETAVTVGGQNVKLDVNEDDLGVSAMAMAGVAPAEVDDDPIAALFLSAEASQEVIEREMARADALAEDEPADLLEFV